MLWKKENGVTGLAHLVTQRTNLVAFELLHLGVDHELGGCLDKHAWLERCRPSAYVLAGASAAVDMMAFCDAPDLIHLRRSVVGLRAAPRHG